MLLAELDCTAIVHVNTLLLLASEPAGCSHAVKRDICEFT